MATIPNTDFGYSKFSRNVERDAEVRQRLEADGWRVFVIWECHVDTQKKAEATSLELANLIPNQSSSFLAHEIIDSSFLQLPMETHRS